MPSQQELRAILGTLARGYDPADSRVEVTTSVAGVIWRRLKAESVLVAAKADDSSQTLGLLESQTLSGRRVRKSASSLRPSSAVPTLVLNTAPDAVAARRARYFSSGEGAELEAWQLGKPVAPTQQPVKTSALAIEGGRKVAGRRENQVRTVARPPC